MVAPIQKHKWIILFTFLVFFLVYQYFAIINPALLINGDDWGYFGSYRSHPIPRTGWNVTRILPEYLMPMTGQLSAFFIYPLVGDYLTSASMALALVMGLFLSIFMISLYRLYRSLGSSEVICALLAVMTLGLFFTLFKDNYLSGNIHMFYGGDYNLYFAYILPNILNSVVVCELMRQLLLNKRLSILPADVSKHIQCGWMILSIYLCIFSMLFSAGILLAFSLSVIIYRFYVNIRGKGLKRGKIKRFFVDCIKNFNIVVITIIGILIAMLLETTSIRANAAEFESTYTGSLFSIDFLNRIGISLSNFLIYIPIMKNYILLIMIFIVLTAGVLFILSKKSLPSKFLKMTSFCLISMTFLFFFYSVLAAKAGPNYIRQIRCVYGVFFYFVLLSGILGVYIIQKVEYLKIFLPLMIAMITMVLINSMWPYNKQSSGYMREMMQSKMDVVIEADRAGHTQIELYVPKDYPNQLWVVRNAFVDALYNHGIIENSIKVRALNYSHDDSFYYVLTDIY